MSLPWVKLHVSLLDNETYRGCSPGARLTFLTCLGIAGKQDRGDYSGRLEVAGIGPMSASGIALYTGLSAKKQAEALAELLRLNLLERDLLGCIQVPRFKEKSAPIDVIRKRTGRNASGNSPDEIRPKGEPEAEVEADSNYASLRSAAIGYGQWPKESPYLNALALIFLDRFANTRDADAIAKFLGSYTSTLAAMRQRGATIEQAWTACEQAREAEAAPLFGGKIRRALDYLPSWRDRPTGRKRQNDRGTDYDKIAEDRQAS